MSEAIGKVLGWLYKAPLPAVIAMMLILGVWVVYTQDALHAEQAQIKAEQTTLASEDRAAKERDTALEAKLDKVDEKLDKLLEAVLESRAQQKAVQDRLDREQARRDARLAKTIKEGQKP